MELSNPKIKKFVLLYNPNLNFFPWKQFVNFFSGKKLILKFFTFWEMELSDRKIKKFLYFPKKRFFYILGNGTFLLQV